MDSSFTIWYNKRAKDGDKPILKLHINLWVNDHKKRNIIDFGFMINNPKNIDELLFYVPFKVTNEDLENLSIKLANNQKITGLVFNSNTTINHDYSEIYNVKTKDDEFELYTVDHTILDTLDGTDIEGSIVKYKFDNELSEKPKYIRLRIKNIPVGTIIKHTQRAVPIISGVSNTLSFLEINFNEFRKLPPKINQKAKENILDISNINVFIMSDFNMEYVFSNIKDIKSRILEKKDWIEYNTLLEENNNNDVLAYHISQKAEKDKDENIQEYLNDFSIFIKFNHEISKMPLIALSFIFLIGLGGSLASNYINDFDGGITIFVFFLIGITCGLFGALYFWIECKMRGEKL